MYQSRSLWCMPSTEISSTCLLTGAGAGAAALAVPCNAESAHAAATALAARHAKVFRLVTGTPVCADLFGAPEFLSRAKSACCCGEQRVNPSKPPVDFSPDRACAAHWANTCVVAGAAHGVGW